MYTNKYSVDICIHSFANTHHQQVLQIYCMHAMWNFFLK